MNDQITFVTNYMDDAIFQLPDVIDRAKRELADLDFDTIVGTGFSGGVVIPALAMALGVNYVLIRKDTDDSHHGAGRMLGTLGKRWLFVDDFTSSGSTRRRVLEKIEDVLDGRDFDSTYVGDYLYACIGEERRLVLADPTESLVAQDDGPVMAGTEGMVADVEGVDPFASDVEFFVAGQVEPVRKVEVALPKSLAALLDEINGSMFAGSNDLVAKPCQDYSAAAAPIQRIGFW